VVVALMFLNSQMILSLNLETALSTGILVVVSICIYWSCLDVMV